MELTVFTRTPHRISPVTSAFPSIPAEELEALDSLSTLLQIDAGRVLLEQGRAGREVFLVLLGDLRVERDGEHVATLGSGSVVGEMALLNKEPRTATVTTATDVTVLTLSRREFSTLLDRCPTLARQILADSDERDRPLAA